MPKPLANDSTVACGLSASNPGPQVADFGGDPMPAGEDAAVDHQGPADAAAHVGVEDDAMAAARPEEGLGQACGVGIVGQRGRQSERFPAPIDQGKVVPALDLVADDRAPGFRIDRPAETDADGPRAVAIDQVAADGVDLAEDPPAPSSRRISARRKSIRASRRRPRWPFAVSCRRFQCPDTWLSSFSKSSR